MFLWCELEWASFFCCGWVLQTANSCESTYTEYNMYSIHHNVVREGLNVFVFQDTFEMEILMARSVKYTINFLEAKEEDLHR